MTVGLDTAFSISSPTTRRCSAGSCTIVDTWTTPDNQWNRPGIRLGSQADRTASTCSRDSRRRASRRALAARRRDPTPRTLPITPAVLAPPPPPPSPGIVPPPLIAAEPSTPAASPLRAPRDASAGHDPAARARPAGAAAGRDPELVDAESPVMAAPCRARSRPRRRGQDAGSDRAGCGAERRADQDARAERRTHRDAAAGSLPAIARAALPAIAAPPPVVELPAITRSATPPAISRSVPPAAAIAAASRRPGAGLELPAISRTKTPPPGLPRSRHRRPPSCPRSRAPTPAPEPAIARTRRRHRSRRSRAPRRRHPSRRSPHQDAASGQRSGAHATPPLGTVPVRTQTPPLGTPPTRVAPPRSPG